MSRVQLLRAGEVAALYGVDESTVHRWERTGRLRCARRDPGGGKYWLEAEIVEDLLADPAAAAVSAAAAGVATLVDATRRPRRRAG